jgi:hypothetical protein
VGIEMPLEIKKAAVKRAVALRENLFAEKEHFMKFILAAFFS